MREGESWRTTRRWSVRPTRARQLPRVQTPLPSHCGFFGARFLQSRPGRVRSALRMLVFAKAPLSAAQSSGSQILRISATRGLHSSRRACYAQDNSVNGSAVTKKSYSELLRTRLSPEGTPLLPLGPWTGGLEPSASDHTEIPSAESTHRSHVFRPSAYISTSC